MSVSSFIAELKGSVIVWRNMFYSRHWHLESVRPNKDTVDVFSFFLSSLTLFTDQTYKHVVVSIE